VVGTSADANRGAANTSAESARSARGWINVGTPARRTSRTARRGTETTCRVPWRAAATQESTAPQTALGTLGLPAARRSPLDATLVRDVPHGLTRQQSGGA
jgi:hypothetical protein